MSTARLNSGSKFVRSRVQASLYYSRKSRVAKVEANPIDRPGRVMLGHRVITQGNETLLTGDNNDMQLSDALAALAGDISIGGDSVTIAGDAVVAGTTDLQGSVKAGALATADGEAGVLYKDAGAANVVKVSS